MRPIKPDGFGEEIAGDPNFSMDRPRIPATRLVGGIIGMLVAFVLLLVGLVLYFGGKAGRLLVFPYAGRLTMIAAVIGLGLGVILAGRRSAMALSGLVAVGGLVPYPVGLAYVEQFGTKVYQAIGLLTTLAGLIGLYVTYGMDRDLTPDGPSKANPGKPG